MPPIFKIIIFLLIGFFSCKSNVEKISEIQLLALDNKVVNINKLQNYKATVITFFSPDCPLSENYTKTINDIEKDYGLQHQINFINIFPGSYYSNDKINAFIKTYDLKNTNFRDVELKLASYLKASITPETFVLDEKGEILYAGAIDNWAVDLGTKRQVITEFYLKDALNAMIKHQPVEVKKTSAVGCYIEKK